MHWRTFDRLVQEHDRRAQEFMRGASKWMSPLIDPQASARSILSYWRNALQRGNAAERVTDVESARAELDRVEAEFSTKSLELWLQTWPTAQGWRFYREAVRQAHRRGRATRFRS